MNTFAITPHSPCLVVPNIIRPSHLWVRIVMYVLFSREKEGAHLVSRIQRVSNSQIVEGQGKEESSCVCDKTPCLNTKEPPG